MTREELNQKFNKAMLKAFEDINPLPYNDSYGARIGYAMMYLMGIPVVSTSYRCNLAIEKEFKLAENKDQEIASQLKKDLDEKINQNTKELDLVKTYIEVINYLDRNGITYITHRNFYEHYIIMEDLAISATESSGRPCFFFVSETGDTPEWFESCIRYKEKKKRDTYKYVVRGQHGFTTRDLDVNDIKVDINMNYNDDMPDEAIKKFLMGDNAGVVIFHGEPGTGKSTYIRHLISTLDKDFLYLDASCFDYLTDASFIEMLFENKNSIIVLEDSEKLLRKRTDSSSNSQVSPLLNLTDGLLGDSMKLKIICTFNAPLDKIDDAILRKGRLKVKYLFNKLNKDKTLKLLETLGVHDAEAKEQTLADIYNYAEKVDFGEVKKRSVGF